MNYKTHMMGSNQGFFENMVMGKVADVIFRS